MHEYAEVFKQIAELEDRMVSIVVPITKELHALHMELIEIRKGLGIKHTQPEVLKTESTPPSIQL